MAFKVCRVFFGGYNPDYTKLQANGYSIMHRRGSRFINVQDANQGLGVVSGKTKKLNVSYSPVPVCLFRRDSRQLLWETTSKADGSYFFRNVAVGLECFIVAFDPNNQYNAVIQDKITPYDGRVG